MCIQMWTALTSHRVRRLVEIRLPRKPVPRAGEGGGSGWIIKIASVNIVGTCLRGDFILMQIKLAILSLGGARTVDTRAPGLESDPSLSFVLSLTLRSRVDCRFPLVFCLSPELPFLLRVPPARFSMAISCTTSRPETSPRSRRTWCSCWTAAPPWWGPSCGR